MKCIYTGILALLLLVVPISAMAQASGGKSGGDEASIGLGGGKGGPTPPPALSEEVQAGSDANQAIENLASPVDPTGDPAGWVDTMVTYWKAGYFLPFAFLLALGLVTLAAKYVPWVAATPKRALVVAAVTAFLGEFVVRLGTGSPLTVAIVMAAFGAAINTWTNGNKAADRSAVATAAKFGPT